MLKKYYPKILDNQLEFISLLSSISKIDNEPFAHLYVSLNDRKHNIYSEYLIKYIVFETVKITINMTGLEIKKDKIIGSNHLQL